MLKDKKFRMLAAICTFAAVCLPYMMLNPILAYVTRDYAYVDETLVTTLATTPRTVAAFITSIIMAPLIMKINRKYIGMFLLFLSSAYSVIYYTVGSTHGEFMLLYAATAMVGIVSGGYGPLLNSIISENYPAEERSSKIARYVAFMNVGNMIYMQGGGILAAGNDGHNWPKAFLLGLLAVVGLIVWTIIMPKDVCAPSASAGTQKKVKFKLSAITPGLFILGLAHLSFYVCQNAYNTSVSKYVISVHEIGTSAQAATATTMGRAVIIFVGATFPFWQKLLKDWMLPVAYLCAIASLALMAVSGSMPALYACSILLNFATGFSFSWVAGKATTLVAPGLAPIAVSFIAFVGNVGGSIAVQTLAKVSPLFGGGFNGKLWAGVLFAAISFVLSLTVRTKVMNPTFDETAAD